MVRSNSRSHSSRSKSGSLSSSRSRSRSHSRKKRYSSRSHSRSYSRSRSRERNYSRDYRRDYRNNRGMRRPYGFRGRGRGYYQGGGGRYPRGGFRPNWNRRYSRSPRRGRSRSRSPKRRSRSRSRSDLSCRSSRSRFSSSSGSSSCCSRSPAPHKKHKSLESKEKQSEGNVTQDTQQIATVAEVEEKKDTDKFDKDLPCSPAGVEKKVPLCSDSWTGLAAYENSPRSHRSASPIRSPTSRSSSSDTRHHSTVNSDQSSKGTSPSLRTPERGGSSRYSPSQLSPLHHSSKRSPVKPTSSQNLQREEARLRSLYSEEKLEMPKVGKHSKRYPEEEETRSYLLDRGNVKDKEILKDRGSERNRLDRERADQTSLDCYSKKETDIMPFLGDSADEMDDYRQFKISSQGEQSKTYPTEAHWNVDCDNEGTKYKTKVALKGEREYEGFGEDRVFKFKDSMVDRGNLTKDKFKEDDRYWDKTAMKKETPSPEQVKSEKHKEVYNPSATKTVDVKEKDRMTVKEESPAKAKGLTSESYHSEVKLKMAALPFDEPLRTSSSLASDRQIASALVHSVKKEQNFRSIFEHIKVPQANKSSSETFIQHIVSLVHRVNELYKTTRITLNERFTAYLKAAGGQTARKKSPEIHRRIDISPSTLKKYTYPVDEEVPKEEFQKPDKKQKAESADLRRDIDRRKKDKNKERGDSKGSRESSSSRKQEVVKGYKDHKKSHKSKSKQKSKDRARSRSHSSSASSYLSQNEKDSKKERDEEFKPHHEQKDYPPFQGGSGTRGNFQFRVRGNRGRARGVFSVVSAGPSNPNVPFQKRNKDEEWDPEYTPKSKKYFLHDDRDDGVDYWNKRGRARGVFQRGRARFNFKKTGSSPKWTHDKYQGDGLLEDEDEG
ncbi:bcl-2-associated transcription factor 1 isoform X2 [Protopterus annectens]|nr:bcl-2-associated transcription factor 1 isoform X2 [Protopterus annectens]